MPKKAGSINGGFYPKENSPAKYPSVVISVDDIRQAMTRVKDAGGKVLGEPVDIPDRGLCCLYRYRREPGQSHATADALSMQVEDISYLRLRTQNISSPLTGGPKDLVSRMGAMQAQDFSMAKWAVGLRTKGATEVSVEKPSIKEKFFGPT